MVALHGAGGGEESNAPGFDFTTNIEWNGPAAGKIIVVRGEIRGVKISDLRVSGSNVSGDLLTLFACKFCSFKNLGLGHGGPDTVGIQLHNGTVGSVFENVRVTQQNDGATGWAFGLGANPNSFGVAQNTLIRCKASFSGSKSTSYGYVFEGADNNTVLQSTAVGNKTLITDATNTTPIVITTAVSHLRQTGATVRILGVNGNTAANGTFTITRLSDSTFSLDGSSGNGAYTSSGIVWGPGHALRFITLSGSNFPKENAFYNSAFFNGFISSTGGHRGNWFFPFATGDQELLPANTGSTGTGEFVGFTQPDFNDGVSSNFAQLIGRWQFARNDNSTAYAKFFPDIGAVAVGDINTVNIGTTELLVRRDGSDAELLIQTATSGNAEVRLGNVGNQTYYLRADRNTNSFNLGTNALGDHLTVSATTGRLTLREAVVPGNVTQSVLPTVGIVYCTDCNVNATCTSGGLGAWARCRSGSCECDCCSPMIMSP